MKIKLDKWFTAFIYAQAVGFDYSIVESLRTPPKFKEFVHDLDPKLSLNHSQSLYGLPELRGQIAVTQGYAVSEDEIYITSGTSEANFLVMSQLIDPGDEIVIDMPSWHQPYPLGKALGANIKIIERREELGWGIDLDELKSIVSPACKLIYLCSPNNPTGAIFNESEMKEICDIARANNAYLLSDEVCRGLEWEGPLSPAAVNYYEKAVSTASVSKTLGLEGIRTGWMATRDQQLIDDCVVFRKNTSEIMNVLGEHIALAALKPEKYSKLLAEAKEEGQKNWGIVNDWIGGNKALSWIKPRGGFLGFIKFDLDMGSEEFYKKLLAKPYRTFVHPGSAYEFDKYFSIGVGGLQPEHLREGLRRVEQFIEDFQH